MTNLLSLFPPTHGQGPRSLGELAQTLDRMLVGTDTRAAASPPTVFPNDPAAALVGGPVDSMLQSCGLDDFAQGSHAIAVSSISLAELHPVAHLIDRPQLVKAGIASRTGVVTVIARGDAGLLSAVYDIENSTTRVSFTSPDQTSLETLARRIESLRTSHVTPDGPLVASGWKVGRFGPEAKPLELTGPTIDEIAHYYPDDVFAGVARLAAGPPRRSGVAVWAGPSGVGKTTAARAVAQAARDWADVHVVSDAPSLTRTQGVIEAIVSSRRTERWNLVIIEDADSVIAHGNPSRPSVGLLNNSDGLLSHQAQTLFLLTCNIGTRQIDPALLRPGRALQVLEFRALDNREVRRWCESEHHQPVPTGELTIAELLADAGRVEHYSNTERNLSVGAYA